MATTHATELYEQVMALPEEERRTLIERLNASVSAGGDGMDEAWVEKMRGRVARVRRGEAKLYTGDEVRARVQERLAQRRK